MDGNITAQSHPDRAVSGQAVRVWYTQGVSSPALDLSGQPASETPIVLASRSPRRRQMLADAGIAHDAEHPGLDDSELHPGKVSPEQWVAALAYLKAAAWIASSGTAAQGRTALGADTAIVKGPDLIGTPASSTEAAEILRRLSSGQHDVVSGVAFIDARTGRRTFFVDKATVRVGHLSDDTIAAYAATSNWQGKAGGYNLRERIAEGWPLEASGDPTTVMGLPMQKLPAKLAAFRAATPAPAPAPIPAATREEQSCPVR